VPLLIDGVDQMNYSSLIFHLILQFFAINSLILNVKLVLFHVLSIMERFMALLILNVLNMMQTVMTLPIHVLKKLRHVLDSKLEIIVFHLNPKILNNKFSITDP